jgi:hypothetical protein
LFAWDPAAAEFGATSFGGVMPSIAARSIFGVFWMQIFCLPQKSRAGGQPNVKLVMTRPTLGLVTKKPRLT